MKAAVILLGLLMGSPAWAAIKCKSPEGKTVYQDQPCEGGEKVNLSGAGQADPNSSGATYWQREVVRQERGRRVSRATADGKIFIGMTAQEAQNSWGRPTKINQSLGSYGVHEQWVYERGNFRTQYVYLQNGVITNIQSPSE